MEGNKEIDSKVPLGRLLPEAVRRMEENERCTVHAIVREISS